MVGIGTESSKGADWVDWLDGGGGAVVDKRVGGGEVETKGTRGWRERRVGRYWSWRSELRGQKGAQAEDVKKCERVKGRGRSGQIRH